MKGMKAGGDCEHEPLTSRFGKHTHAPLVC
jgi:hypothetical protein